MFLILDCGIAGSRTFCSAHVTIASKNAAPGFLD
jgi:hypothetical protein